MRQSTSHLTYSIWSDRLVCRLESGDPGADEVEIYATLANFPTDEEQPPDVRIDHPPRGAPFDGMSQGETYSYLWNVLGEGERGVAVPEVLAIALIGYERDSADALRDAVRQWFDAFQLFFRELWSIVNDRIATSCGRSPRSAPPGSSWRRSPSPSSWLSRSSGPPGHRLTWSL